MCSVSRASELCTFTRNVGAVYSSAFLVGGHQHVFNLAGRFAYHAQYILPRRELGHAYRTVPVQQILPGNSGSVVGGNAAHLDFNGALGRHGIRRLGGAQPRRAQHKTKDGTNIFFHGAMG